LPFLLHFFECFRINRNPSHLQRVTQPWFTLVVCGVESLRPHQDKWTPILIQYASKGVHFLYEKPDLQRFSIYINENRLLGSVFVPSEPVSAYLEMLLENGRNDAPYCGICVHICFFCF